MQIWVWIGIVLLLLVVGLLFSSIRIEFRYLRQDQDDEMEITFYALGNLIRYQKKITQLIWEDLNQGVKMNIASENEEMQNTEWVTESKLEKINEIKNLLVDRIDRFYLITRRFMNQIVCEKLAWKTSIGTGDAAETGVLVGAMWGAKTMLIGWIGRLIRWKTEPQIEIDPRFVAVKLEIDLHSIIRFRIGHAILAFNRFVFQLIIHRRDKKWPNTPFKA